MNKVLKYKVLLIFTILISSCNKEKIVDLTKVNYDDVFSEDLTGVYYKDKLFTGKIIKYDYIDGPLLFEKNFVNGIRDGLDVTYWKNGNINEKTIRRNDSIISYELFYEDGFMSKSYDKYGKIIHLQRFKNGSIDTIRYHLTDSINQIVFPIKGNNEGINNLGDNYIVKLTKDTIVLEKQFGSQWTTEKFFIDKSKILQQLSLVPYDDRISLYGDSSENEYKNNFSFLNNNKISIFNSTYNKLSYKLFKSDIKNGQDNLLIEEGKYKNGLKHGIWKEYQTEIINSNYGLEVFGFEPTDVETFVIPKRLREKKSKYYQDYDMYIKFPKSIKIFDNGDLIEETEFYFNRDYNRMSPTLNIIYKSENRKFLKGTSEKLGLETLWYGRKYHGESGWGKLQGYNYYVKEYNYYIVDKENSKKTKKEWYVGYEEFNKKINWVGGYDQITREWNTYYDGKNMIKHYNKNVKKTLDSILNLNSTKSTDVGVRKLQRPTK